MCEVCVRLLPKKMLKLLKLFDSYKWVACQLYQNPFGKQTLQNQKTDSLKDTFFFIQLLIFLSIIIIPFLNLVVLYAAVQYSSLSVNVKNDDDGITLRQNSLSSPYNLCKPQL